MQTAAARSFLVTEFSSLSRFGFTQVEARQEGFYQQLALDLARRVHSRQIFENLAQRLIAIADRAYSVRRMEVVDQVCQILMNLPLPCQYERVCRYYQALCSLRQKKFADAGLLLEQIVEETPVQHKPKVIMSLAASHFGSGDFKSALSLHIEAGKALASNKLSDPFAAITTHRMLAVLKSIGGNHQGALDDLEKLFPLAHSVSRHNGPLFCDFLNSYSVELTEVGRLDEARNVMRLVLASPFASAYPEWRETGEEIERRGRRPFRSKVVFTERTPKENNLAFLPQREEERRWTPNPFQQSAPVGDFQKWKDTMGKKSNGDTKNDISPSEKQQQRAEMSTSDKILKILSLINSGLSDDELDKVIDLLEEINSQDKRQS